MAKSRFWAWIQGIVILAFGLGCLNYTRFDGIEHHRESAAAHSLPPPAPWMFLTGVAATVVGAAFLGFLIAMKRRPPAEARPAGGRV